MHDNDAHGQPDVVSLVKADRHEEDDEDLDELDDEPVPGAELVRRVFGRVLLRQPGEVVLRHDELAVDQRPHLVVRARQAAARQTIWLVDQPAVARTVAVGRQLPVASWRLVWCAPRGAVRATVGVADWLRDSRSSELLTKHADAGEGESYAKVAKARQDSNLESRRWLVGAVAGVAVLLGMAWWAPAAFAGVLAVLAFVGTAAVAPRRDLQEWLWGLAFAAGLGAAAWWWGDELATLVPRPPGWVWWALAGVLVLVCGWVGRREDQPLVKVPPSHASTKPPIITAPMMIGALIAMGNSKMREPDSIRVLGDPHRTGMFVQIDLELPRGVIAAWVVENREQLAAAMRRPMSMVWPRVGAAHPGHLVVLGSEIPMNEMEQEPWPLLAATSPIDVFRPQPVFTNQLGEWVYLTLAYASWVIGAVPRMGKTFTVRELLLIYGMDPRVKMIALDGKGTGDLAPLEPFAHLHVRGARVDKPENIQQVRELVRWLLGEMGRRADVLADLPFDEVPDSKVTSELINAHPELDLGPIAVGIDETQSFFSYGFKGSREHKEIREEIRDGVIELMRMGPALGIWVILATQTVRDSTIPTEAQAIAVYRYALKLEGWEPNDKVLGTGAHRAGITATIFGFEEKGIGWFKGEGAKPFIARSVVGLDAVATRAMASRVRAWRAARGMLTGQAGDDEIEDAEIVIDIVADAETVVRQHQRTKAQHAEVVEWLRELRPENYSELDVDELSARLRGRGVPISQVWSNGRNAKGVKLADLRECAGP